MGTWDERVGRAVGRRVPVENSIADAAILLDTITRLMPAGICARGVWRFDSFEEADEWTLSQAARRRAPRA